MMPARELSRLHLRLFAATAVAASLAGRVRLARRLFAYLVTTQREPSSLPDAFYVRVSLALGGQLPAHKILLSLLPPTTVRADLET